MLLSHLLWGEEWKQLLSEGHMTPSDGRQMAISNGHWMAVEWMCDSCRTAVGQLAMTVRCLS